MQEILNKKTIQCLLIIVTTFLCYINVGDVPFYLDDFSSIVNNSTIHAPYSYNEIWYTQKARFFAYALFANELESFKGKVEYFHYVGVFLHIFVTLVVALLAYLLSIRCHFQYKKNIFLVTGLIFAVLPQNTQAVIYVVQQTTVIAALFYILSLCFYICIRQIREEQIKQANSNYFTFVYTVAFVISAFVAFHSKQNTFTLPLAILLVEWLFFKKYTRIYVKISIAVFLLAVGMMFYLYGNNLDELMSKLDSASRETSKIDRLDYFRTQLIILFHYMTQFFTMSEFRLEYDFKLVDSWTLQSILALLFHVVLVLTAIIFRKKLQLFTFGILFYYLAHSIESSLLPIKDLAFEHRTYLPNVGLTIAACGFILPLVNFFEFLKRFAFLNRFKLQSVAVVLLFIFTCYVTYERVNTWSKPTAFYKNETVLSPTNPRAYAALAGAIQDGGDCAMAIGYYDHSMALYRRQHQSNLGLQPEVIQNYITCLRELRILDKAAYYEDYLLEKVKDPIKRSIILWKKGVFYITEDDFHSAEASLTEATKLNPKRVEIVMSLVITKIKLNKLYHAKRLLQHILSIAPSHKYAVDLMQQINVLEMKNKK